MADILIVDDEKNLRWSLRIALEEQGHTVEEVASGEECLDVLRSRPQDLVFLDIRLPGRDGMDVLQEIRRAHSDTIVIMMSAYGQAETADDAKRMGAYYFLPKPFELKNVIHLLGDAMVNLETAREARNAKQIRVGNREADRFIIGSSPRMGDIVGIIEKVAASTTATVLIQGESGTGKELVAKAIHHLSHKNERRPFLAINCAGLPENLLESELFGHEKGAFTDARERKRGLLEIANSGTLFLDEIGEMPLGLQGRLLRVLETKSFRCLGGVQDIEVDLRIVAATNRDLKREAQEGRFREDLFFRLNVVPIDIPPLRERRRDVPVLASYFVQLYNRELNRMVRGFSPGARRLLQAYDWPGNVRELRNVIERAILLESADVILESHLPIELTPAEPVAVATLEDPAEEFVPRALREIELEYIRRTLDHFNGNKSQAARTLGISRQTLRDKLQAAERAMHKRAAEQLEGASGDSPPVPGKISVGSARN
ncbi:MAG TPA: sigma-54 dependent transcriptional regulator [bacterium]|nr:sigma-54 dependent transcriptional regulator [bacterium]